MKSISRNVLFYFIALWIFIYILSTTIAGVFPPKFLAISG